MIREYAFPKEGSNMKQQTFTDIEYSNRKRRTRREKFLDTMDRMMPWKEWVDLIRPVYPSGKRGRPPKDIETMLRMYLMQKWFGLSAAALEDAIYDSHAMRDFMHLDFLKEQVPGASTLSRFRKLLSASGIEKQIDEDISRRLRKAGMMLRCGKITDAAIVSMAGTRKK